MPWGQNITLLTKLKTSEERLLYAARAVEHGWSRPLLTHHIELRTLEREGKAVTNFDQRLPKPQSDLARETLKDSYRFDFLSLGSEAEEREIEAALVTHITKFLLELGAGFAFVGRQVHLEVGGRDFYIDLLSQTRYWKIAPGEDAKLWETWRTSGFIAISDDLRRA